MNFSHKICRLRPRLRQLFFIVFVFMWLYLCAAPAYSGLAGKVCSECHTMHNSQGGAVMTFGGQATAGSMLLRGASCGGCHADATANSSSTMGDFRNAIPQVDVSIAADMLAGGSFDWVQGAGVADDPKGHNVKDLGIAVDGVFSWVAPPGFVSGTANGVGSSWGTNQLTCAGTYGCHGDHSFDNKFKALQGAHHNNSGNDGLTIVGGSGATVGDSYRFLKTIQGIEAAGVWKEEDAIHNVYFGSTGGSTFTISALCAQCHGDFHQSSGIGTASPWLRHPTDIDMKVLGGEFGSYVYSLASPVATSTPKPGNSDNTVPYDSEIVTSLSCHRAHGSDYDDLLRWNYRGANAGCVFCHTSKG